MKKVAMAIVIEIPIEGVQKLREELRPRSSIVDLETIENYLPQNDLN